MGNERDVRYPYRVGVRLTPDQREALRANARVTHSAISVIMREAALVAIGRPDLSLLDPDTDVPYGKMIERARDEPDTSKRLHASQVGVNLSGPQLQALSTAARKQDKYVSAILRDAGLRACGLPTEKLARGRRGKRADR